MRYIYDTVVAALRVNSQRKFVFVETAYFMRWWREQNAEIQEATRTLFANGQLEFINGGWCMADDASPNTDAIIDQVAMDRSSIRGMPTISLLLAYQQLPLLPLHARSLMIHTKLSTPYSLHARSLMIHTKLSTPYSTMPRHDVADLSRPSLHR